MGTIARTLLRSRLRRLERLRQAPGEAQDEVARALARTFASTELGRLHGLSRVRSARDLSAAVPLREYEELAPLLPKRPRYWGVTSGTTGPQKVIPITRELLRANGDSWSLLLSTLFAEVGFAPLLGRLLFLGACTPMVAGEGGIPRGVITSVTVHAYPRLIRARLLPGTRLDALPDWGAKMDALVDMARGADVRIVSGMPPWLVAFAAHMEKRWGVNNLHQIWPKLSVVVHSGASPEPYRAELEARFGPALFRNAYGATEGFIAMQDTEGAGLLPMADRIFLEFIPVEDLTKKSPRRILLAEVEPGVEYAVACSTFAGLFGYVLGDTVCFESRSPPRMILAGRVHQRLNITGEQVTSFHVERAVERAAKELKVEIAEASVYAVPPSAGRPAYHVWFLELRSGYAPSDALAGVIDRSVKEQTSFYVDSRVGVTPLLGPPEVRLLPPGAFHRWLHRIGRVGGQHKVPRILHEVPEEFRA